jgi:hypothetical protein
VLDFWGRTSGRCSRRGISVRAGRGRDARAGAPGGLEAFIDYEAELNLFTKRHPQLVLVCMYDLDLFGGSIVLDLVRTRSRLLLGGLVLDNPHFQPPPGWGSDGAAVVAATDLRRPSLDVAQWNRTCRTGGDRVEPVATHRLAVGASFPGGCGATGERALAVVGCPGDDFRGSEF